MEGIRAKSVCHFVSNFFIKLGCGFVPLAMGLSKAQKNLKGDNKNGAIKMGPLKWGQAPFSIDSSG